MRSQDTWLICLYWKFDTISKHILTPLIALAIFAIILSLNRIRSDEWAISVSILDYRTQYLSNTQNIIFNVGCWLVGGAITIYTSLQNRLFLSGEIKSSEVSLKILKHVKKIINLNSDYNTYFQKTTKVKSLRRKWTEREWVRIKLPWNNATGSSFMEEAKNILWSI